MEKALMHRLALNLAHSKTWALVFCSERRGPNLGARTAPKGPQNADGYQEYHPRVSEHRDFRHVGLTGAFPHTALCEELVGFLLKI